MIEVFRDKQASAAIRSSLIRTIVGRPLDIDAQNDEGEPIVLLRSRLGTWESAPVQWLDRGYTDVRMAACDDPCVITMGRAGGAGAQI
jgi:hypothetical protein